MVAGGSGQYSHRDGNENRRGLPRVRPYVIAGTRKRRKQFVSNPGSESLVFAAAEVRPPHQIPSPKTSPGGNSGLICRWKQIMGIIVGYGH